MVKNFEKALRIQQRRYDLEKVGIAKAVLRFLRREYTNRDEYNDAMRKLPFRRSKK